ncbi:hypothetical protein [Mycobacterium sp. AZCC_0083]|nr:hypothetical protein [Mycobacterium sp. AZCC_0083]
MSEMKYLDLHGDRVAYREAGSFGDLAVGPAALVEEIPGGDAGSARTR